MNRTLIDCVGTGEGWCFRMNGARELGFDAAFTEVAVSMQSHIWISSTFPHSAPLLRVNICEGALLRANLFGKMFLGHIIFIREGVSWTKVSY